ncbi:MAG: PEP-CTERM/exosortase system-associated acyltransferase [Beggiatoa sp.]|nr:PEP-CTERM/exosortase system-associated acyltransferase [Beggiatoa sp.]
MAEVLRAPHAPEGQLPERHLMHAGPDLLTHFMRHFEILRADTPALLEEAFRLRYQVYCQEGCLPGFDPLDYPDGLERDIYDYENRSVHCLLRHRATGSNAGTVRLVLADPVQPDALFPIEVAAGEQIDRNYLRKHCAARGTIGECSRFLLARQFRARAGEARWADGVAEVIDLGQAQDERRAPTHPVLGLLKAGMIMSWERQVCYWYTGMEPRLDRRLRQFAFALQPISPAIDYHGPCRAHWGYLPDVLAHTRERRSEVWRLLTGDGEIWPTDTSGTSAETTA